MRGRALAETAELDRLQSVVIKLTKYLLKGRTQWKSGKIGPEY